LNAYGFALQRTDAAESASNGEWKGTPSM
jgi:hypothetical protein